MKKLLLVMGSELMAEALCQRLAGCFEIQVCLESEQVADAIWGFAPDVMGLDLMLTGLDGVDYIRAARNYKRNCRVFAVSSYFSNYMTAALEKEKVSYLVQIPCSMDHLAEQIVALSLGQEKDDRYRIGNLLLSLGFRQGYAGFYITEVALRQYVMNPGQSITGELYPGVAAEIGGTTSQVEKAIRYGIENAMKYGDIRLWKLYFPIGRSGKVDRPTNKTFLERISACLMEEYTQKKTFVG